MCLKRGNDIFCYCGQHNERAGVSESVCSELLECDDRLTTNGTKIKAPSEREIFWVAVKARSEYWGDTPEPEQVYSRPVIYPYQRPNSENNYGRIL